MSRTVDTIIGSFDEARYKLLKKAYQRAVSDKSTEFEFQGHELLTQFVKYVLELLEQTFKPSNNK